MSSLITLVSEQAYCHVCLVSGVPVIDPQITQKNKLLAFFNVRMKKVEIFTFQKEK